MDQIIKVLEAKRQSFLTLFKRTKTTNLIILGIFVIAMIPVFIFLLPANSNLGLLVIGALLIAMFVYSRSAKTWLNQRVYRYIFDYYHEVANFYYQQSPFSQIEIKEREGMNVEEFRNLGLLKNVISLISRNCISGEIIDTQFQVCDAGVRIGIEKRIAVAFFGRIFRFKLPSSCPGHYIVHRQYRDDAILPDGFNDFEPLEVSGKRFIYGQDKTMPKLLSHELLKILDSFELGNELMDVTAVIKDDYLYLLLSYNDAIMNVAYEHAVIASALERFDHDLRLIEKLVKTLH